MPVLPILTNIATKLIGCNIVPTAPMPMPSGKLFYMDSLNASTIIANIHGAIASILVGKPSGIVQLVNIYDTKLCALKESYERAISEKRGLAATIKTDSYIFL